MVLNASDGLLRASVSLQYTSDRFLGHLEARQII